MSLENTSSLNPEAWHSIVPTSHNCYVALHDKFILMLQFCQVFPSLVLYMAYTVVFSVYCKGLCLILLQWVYWWFLFFFFFLPHHKHIHFYDIAAHCWTLVNVYTSLKVNDVWGSCRWSVFELNYIFMYVYFNSPNGGSSLRWGTYKGVGWWAIAADFFCGCLKTL
jgi:hypothetical protein